MTRYEYFVVHSESWGQTIK